MKSGEETRHFEAFSTRACWFDPSGYTPQQAWVPEGPKGHGAKRFKPAGYPKYQKGTCSVEYKTSGWKLLDPKHVRFTDKSGIGSLKLIGTWDLGFYQRKQIKRVRILRRADGYYVPDGFPRQGRRSSRLNK